MSRVPARSIPLSAIRFPQLLELAPNSELVFFIAHFFHPIDDFPVQRLLNGNVSHCGRRRSAVPMLLVRRKPDHITRPDFLDRPAPTLRPPNARRDDQRLTEWMRVPCGASTRLERDACAANTCRVWRLEKRINGNCPGEPIRRLLG